MKTCVEHGTTTTADCLACQSVARTQEVIRHDDCVPGCQAFARMLYAAYTRNSGNKNYQGLPCPTWEDLPHNIKSHWCAVAEAAGWHDLLDRT